jgi:hypothetical protein
MEKEEKMKNERKEELKDEMKNRISMALKDPILQQGFEIICKENAELRKFRELLAVGSKLNKGLISRNKFLEKERDKYRNMVFDKMEQHEDEVKLLKKENAELKKQLEMSNKVYNDNLDYSYHIENQLTKAKGIIKDYIIIVEGDHTTVCSVPEENRCINVLKLNEEAKQFLRDVEIW